MANNIKGITVVLEADTTKLGAALKDVNTQATNIGKELKQVNNSLKFNPKDTVLLSQKQKLLGDQISTTKDKLDKLKAAEKQVQEQFERGDIGEENYRAFQREVVETESKLKHYKNQLKEVNKENSVFGQKLDVLSSKLKSAGEKIKNVGKGLSTKLTLPIAGAGAAAFKFAADLEDAMGASDQIFKGAANEVKTWADNLQGYYGIAEGEALDYANTMGAMLQNIGGLSEQEAAKQSQMLVELAGDLTAMFGGTTESAVQALTGALKGNTAMLDNYGMGVNDATIKAKAFEMGLYDGKGQMSLSAKQAATLALIMEQTADAQGQAAREAEGASGSLRTLGTELKNMAGDLGEELIPILMPFIEKLKEMVEKFKELSPEQKEMIVKIALIAAAIGPLLVVFGTFAKAIGTITSLGSSLVKNWGSIKAFGGLLAGGLKATVGFLFSPAGLIMLGIASVIAIGILLYKNWDKIKEKAGELKENISTKFEEIKTSLSNAWESIKDGVKTFLDAITLPFRFAWEVIKSIIQSSLAIIEGVIGTVLNVIKYLWQIAWESIKNFVQPVWEKIKSTISNAINAVKEVVGNVINKIKDTMSNVWNQISTTALNIWDKIKSVIEGPIQKARDSVSSVINNIKTKMSEVFNSIKATTTDVFNNIKSAIETPINNAKAAISNTVDSMKNKMVATFDSIKSKATSVFEGIKNAIEKPINKAKETVNTAINAIKGFFNGLKLKFPDIQPPKLPKFKINGKFSFNPPSVPTLGIDWNAGGGIFKRPTVLPTMAGLQGFAEPRTGGEAIMPLNKLPSLMADAMRQVGNGGDTVINVYNPQPSPSELARQIKKSQRDLALGW